MSLSVAIMSFNEEHNIGRCLATVKDIADEIVVVDSLSTDRTIEIAKSYGAKVYSEPFKGHVAQQNSSLDKCTSDWVLFIDCDEAVSPELAVSIKQAITTGREQVYILSRRSFYMGRLLRHAWHPDSKLRLMKRNCGARFAGQDPHLYLKWDGRYGMLSGNLIHYSYKDFDTHMNKMLWLSKVWKGSHTGKRVSGFDIFILPVVAFFKAFILKGAVLDGTRGLIAAYSSAMAVYTKYTYLWESQNMG
ncbi:beta 1,4 glucosyltransferase [Deferribacterales bacterium RsTz2092]|nr:beta 1,4 glucosyltransferase [Deferribacterales bacterium]